MQTDEINDNGNCTCKFDHEFNEYIERKRISYSVKLSAWYQTRSEIPKSILALSSSAIGLLIALVSAFGVGIEQLKLLIISSSFFFISIIFSILIFRMNSDYLKALIINEGQEENVSDKEIKRFTLFSWSTFLLGLLTMFFLIVISTKNKLEKDKLAMSKENSKSEVIKKIIGTSATRDFSGAAELEPAKPTNSKKPQSIKPNGKPTDPEKD